MPVRSCLAIVASISFVTCVCTQDSPAKVRRDDDTPKPLSARSAKDIKETLAKIHSNTMRPNESGAAERHDALKRLQAYRYLAGVPYENLVLDEEYNKLARAGARLCEKLGRIDHNPENPGVSADEYELGVKGTRASNLAQGYATLARALDGWMDDSDGRNIERLGHRRWCLFPYLQKAGFGRAGKFSAMYVFDRSQTDVPDYDHISFPPPGPMPVEYFGASWAWNVTLNPQKYALPEKSVKPELFEVDKQGKKLGGALTLNHASVNNDPFGLPGCLIFRPERLQLRPLKRYLVEIAGLKRTDGQPAEVLTFTVEFVTVR